MFTTDYSDLKAWHAKIRQFAKTIGKTVGEVFRDECRLVVDRAIAYTPPQGGMTEGKNAVARDIKKAIYPLKPNFDGPTKSRYDKGKINKAIRERNFEALRAIFSRCADASLKRAEVVPFAFRAGGRNHPMHQSQRDKRGRVLANNPKYATPDVDVVGAYIEQVQTHVGMARGGWMAALTGLGGSGSAWYGRHAEQGTWTESWGDGLEWTGVATNRSQWAKYHDEAQRILNNAVEGRIVQIQAKIEHEIEKKLKEA